MGNKQKRRIWMAVLLCMLGGASGTLCANVAVPVQTVSAAETAEIKINKSSAVITKGGSDVLTLKGTKKKPVWKSKDTKIVKVSSTGIIKGVNTGTTWVYATLNGVKYKCKVTVVELSHTEFTGKKGDTLKLSLRGMEKGSTFFSKDKSVATVTAGGTITITGSTPGAQTKVYTRAGAKTFSCTVKVTNPFYEYLTDRGFSEAKAAEMAVVAQTIYDSCKVDEKTPVQVVHAIHDSIVEWNSYDYVNYLNKSIPRSSFGIDGVLLKETSVCQGYAETLQMFFTIAGIENKLVVGKGCSNGHWESHAWNLVRLDGSWYHVDSTWDDPVALGEDGIKTEMLVYDYFLKSDKDMSKDHSWNQSDYPKAAGGVYEHYMEEFELELHRKQGTLLDSVTDVPDYVLRAIGDGSQSEYMFEVVYPEKTAPDYSDILLRVYYATGRNFVAMYYPICPLGEYSKVKFSLVP